MVGFNCFSRWLCKSLSKKKFQNTAEIADRFLMLFYTMAESEALFFRKSEKNQNIFLKQDADTWYFLDELTPDYNNQLKI